ASGLRRFRRTGCLSALSAEDIDPSSCSLRLLRLRGDDPAQIAYRTCGAGWSVRPVDEWLDRARACIDQAAQGVEYGRKVERAVDRPALVGVVEMQVMDHAVRDPAGKGGDNVLGVAGGVAVEHRLERGRSDLAHDGAGVLDRAYQAGPVRRAQRFQ